MNLVLDELLLQGAESSIKETNEYFHLLEHPFLSGPDYRFLYTTDQVKDAIAQTLQHIFQRTLPVYMYGEYGNGKTTIVMRLYSLLLQDKRFQVKFVKATANMTRNALLRDILAEFDQKPARSAHQSLNRLQEYLLGLDEEARPVLLIDEAHYIEDDGLSVLHSIFSLETAKAKQLHIVLAGQLPLAQHILARGELASRMKPVLISTMSAEELKKMLLFRWAVAGGNEEDFPVVPDDHQSFEILATYTKGVPRDALKVASDVLTELWKTGRQKTTPEEIESIAIKNNLPLQQQVQDTR